MNKMVETNKVSVIEHYEKADKVVITSIAKRIFPYQVIAMPMRTGSTICR